MRSKAGKLLLAAGALSLALTGCQGEPRGVVIPPGAESLSPCGVAQVAIDELADLGDPGCDLAGASLTFSAGVVDWRIPSAPPLVVPAVGAVFTHGDAEGHELLVVNCGVPGVGVAALDSRGVVEIWASTDTARELHQQQLAIDGVTSD